MNDPIYRVEAKNHKNGFDLLGIKFSLNEAQKLAEENDKYFIRIVDCRNNRKPVFRNYGWQDLLDI